MSILRVYFAVYKSRSRILSHFICLPALMNAYICTYSHGGSQRYYVPIRQSASVHGGS